MPRQLQEAQPGVSAPVTRPVSRRSVRSVIDLDAAEITAPEVTKVADRVMFVASNGGHLAQLLALQTWWSGRERSWVCFDKPDARSQLEAERTVWAHWPTTRNLPNLLRNFVLAVRTMRTERPEVVVSTGAAVALPFFVIARLMGIPTIYIEVYDRLDSRTLSGRLCKPFSTHFLVQWPEQAALYRGSTVVGPLL
jgi:UDP-N-acetylglucosamine:LPS N-acetylglucosamine transferase